MTDSHGTSRYSYDGGGRLLSVTDPNGATVSYSYDALGRKKAVTVPSGTTEYDYDEFGRLASVIDPDGNETRYTYDEHGNKASMIYPNGTITEYGYDTLNRLILVETRSINGALLASYSYALNAKGQRTHVEEQPTGRLIDYEYDAADRLIEERINDPVGNRLTKDDRGVITAYTYDDNDRLLTETGLSYTYDHNGNMLTKSGNGETWQLDYNALNQLTHANISTPQGSSTVDYAYDHDGIRIGKTINGTEMIQYVVDKNRPYTQVLEEEHTHSLLSATTSYVYGDALISSTTEGLTHYYHADGMGSIRALRDVSGNMIDSYVYDAYGMVSGSRGTTVNPYLYRGEQYDPDLDSYYLRARYYQPGIGRFLMTDPSQGVPTTPMSLHRYLYGNANPVNVIDPSGSMGLAEQITVGTIGTIIGNIAVSQFMGIFFQDVYVALGETIFPDAFVVGVSGSIPRDVSGLLESIFSAVPGALETLRVDTTGNVIGAFEGVFSTTSAEIALFGILGGGINAGLYRGGQTHTRSLYL